MDETEFNDYKEKGNACIKEKKYEEAIGHYTSALELKSSEHTVFSNRSLAYLRVGKLENALSDACVCVEICPTFARGFMRKAVAFNMLSRYEEAREASVAGYLLRGSDSICKECISQWLFATEKLFSDFYKSGVLPTGTVILSDAYFVTLFSVLESRQSSASGMSAEKMKKHFQDVVQQLKDTLAVFGHSCDSCLDQWEDSICNYSFKMNPQSSMLPKDVPKLIIAKSEAFAKWVNHEVCSTLYPVVRPLLILAVMVILAHTYTLNCMNLGHMAIQMLSQACLVLFEKSILTTEVYLGHHIGTILGLLDSFVGRGTGLSKEDLQIMEYYCSVTEKLLSQYEKTASWEKKELKDIAIRVIANVRNVLKYKSGGVFIHSESLPQESLMSGEVAKRDALTRPSEVIQYMEALVKEVKLKHPSELLCRDAENLLHGSVGLMKLKQTEKSLEAFTLGEQTLFRILALQAKSGIWTLEDAPAMISTSRNDVLLNALILHELDSSLLPDVLVRWKCLYSEFRAMLMHFGLRNNFSRAFTSIDELRRSGRLMETEAATNLEPVMKQYQLDQKEIVEKWGGKLMLLFSQQSHRMIQQILEPNEAILEIAVVGTAPENIHVSESVGVMGILVLLLPKGSPVVEIVNFRPLAALFQEWPQKLNEVITSLSNEVKSDAKSQEEADIIGKKISDFVFPKSIKNAINSRVVDVLYICPDLSLSNLPLDLLPWENGKYLFERCSTSYLSSCREALREWGIHSLLNQKDDAEAVAKRNPVTNSVSTECILFADPDYDMKADSEEGMLSFKFWDLLKDSLGISSDSQKKGKLDRLPTSIEEVEKIKETLSLVENVKLNLSVVSGNNATLLQAIQMNSPFLVHFSTHGFSNPRGGNLYGGNFWTDMTTGLALAGINTYRYEESSKIIPAAGTGELTAMAVCGINLRHTRLVYLSTCKSSLGFTTAGESVGSLAQAFRAAGAETVIGTLWPVTDEAAKIFSIHFYKALCKNGTKPSQAIVEAKQHLRQEEDFKNWFFWAPFICVGYNMPLLC